ncbi:MAG: hypothetical protein ACRD11_09405 [Terriglobia bacterium]
MKTYSLVFHCRWVATSTEMFLPPYQVAKEGKDYTYWSLVETVRTSEGRASEPESSARAREIHLAAVLDRDS